MMDRIVDDEDWERSVEAHLRAVVPWLIPGRHDVEGVEAIAPDVWLLRLSRGARVVAKHQFYGILTRDESFDLLQVEFDVLRMLRRNSASVPVPIAIDPDAQFIFLEYAGSRTLADALCAGETGWTRRAVHAQRGIESWLAEDGHWQSRVIPGATIQDLHRSWAAVLPVALAGLTRWAATVGAPQPIDDLSSTVIDVHRRLSERAPTLGAVDYQPRNVICSNLGNRLAFLELGKLGWDWTERRALQYTTPLEGTGLPTSRATGLRELAAAMPDKSSLQALDMHHLVFRLVLAARDPATAGLELLDVQLSDEPAMRRLRQKLSESMCHQTDEAACD